MLSIVCLILAVAIGSVPISWTTFWGTENNLTVANQRIIVEQIRIPRALLAALVGAILGMCGAITQGLFRNPLADPSLIGVTAGAAVGASLVIVLGGSTISYSTAGLSLVSIGAFAGAVATVTLVYRLATQPTGTSVATMLLAGIAITALAGGITSLLEYLADNDSLRRMTLWRMGGLDGANYRHLLLIGVIGLLLFGMTKTISVPLNAMLLGESEARHLGIRVQRIKMQLIVLVAAGVGTAVSITGSIAFVGLVVPHIMRLIVGPNHSALLPASALGGAILLTIADTFARTVIAPTELPVGIITALIGAPFFIYLLRQRHNYGMQQ